MAGRWHEFLNSDEDEKSGFRRELKKRLKKQEKERDSHRLRREATSGLGSSDHFSVLERSASPGPDDSVHSKAGRLSSLLQTRSASSWSVADDDVDELYKCTVTEESSPADKAKWILRMGNHLLFQGTIAIPVLWWDGDSPEEALVRVSRGQEERFQITPTLETWVVDNDCVMLGLASRVEPPDCFSAHALNEHRLPCFWCRSWIELDFSSTVTKFQSIHELLSMLSWICSCCINPFGGFRSERGAIFSLLFMLWQVQYWYFELVEARPPLADFLFKCRSHLSEICVRFVLVVMMMMMMVIYSKDLTNVCVCADGEEVCDEVRVCDLRKSNPFISSHANPFLQPC